jgi:hypothetical protein
MPRKGANQERIVYALKQDGVARLALDRKICFSF